MAGTTASLAAALIAIATFVGATAAPAANYYLNPEQADLVHILAPPPAPDSAKAKTDLQCVLAAQRQRTPAEVKSVRADVELSVFRFADVMGPRFQPENLPFAAQFFARVGADDEHAIDRAKEHFHRPRPSIVDHAVKPVVGAKNSYGSYPSGHATFAYATAILLAKMVPEKAAAIFDRADRFAENRVIGGVHYPTDVEAGRVSGSVIDYVLLHQPRFEADFTRASAEVRHALGLSPAPQVN